MQTIYNFVKFRKTHKHNNTYILCKINVYKTSFFFLKKLKRNSKIVIPAYDDDDDYYR